MLLKKILSPYLDLYEIFVLKLFFILCYAFYIYKKLYSDILKAETQNFFIDQKIIYLKKLLEMNTARHANNGFLGYGPFVDIACFIAVLGCIVFIANPSIFEGFSFNNAIDNSVSRGVDLDRFDTFSVVTTIFYDKDRIASAKISGDSLDLIEFSRYISVFQSLVLHSSSSSESLEVYRYDCSIFLPLTIRLIFLKLYTDYINENI